MMSEYELLVKGYCHEMQRVLNIDIVDDISSVIILFYPKCIDFEGCTINLTNDEKEQVTHWINDALLQSSHVNVLSSELLYDMDTDGNTGKTFHRKCDGHPNLFGIIKMKDYDHIIGYFLSKSFTDKTGFISDDKVFICLIRSCFKKKKPQIFKIKSDRVSSAFRNIAKDHPVIGKFDLWIALHHRNLTYNMHRKSTAFKPAIAGNILCGGKYYNGNEVRYVDAKIEHYNVFTIHNE